jgi:hypothetical protein
MTNRFTWACVRDHCQYYLWCFGGCGCFAFGLLSMRSELTNQKWQKYLCAYAYAWVTGGMGICVCNVAIFLCKIVTCTSYGASLWDSVMGYGVFPRRIYSDCTHQFLFCQQNNYFLDVIMLSHYY